MEMMRKCLVFLVLLAGLVSCDFTLLFDEPTGPENLTIQLDKKSLSAAETTIQVTVLCDWSWEGQLVDAPWAKASEVTDYEGGRSQFTLTLELNTGQDPRTGSLVIRSGDKEERVSFTQQGLADFFFPGSIVLRGTAEAYTYFSAPTAWTAQVTEGAEWLQVKNPKGEAGSITLTCFASDPNEDTGERNGVISVTFAGGTLTLPVKQLQKDVIIASETAFAFTFEGGTFSVVTATNVSYDISVSADWVHRAETKALNESVESFVVDPNEKAEGRSTEIIFTDKDDPDATVAISVVQGGKDPIINKTTPGLYGIDGKDYILATGGWNQSSRSVAADGRFTYRLLNAASLSVVSVAGIDPNAGIDTPCNLTVTGFTKKNQTLNKDIDAHVVYTTEELLYLRADEKTYFIIQK